MSFIKMLSQWKHQHNVWKKSTWVSNTLLSIPGSSSVKWEYFTRWSQKSIFIWWVIPFICQQTHWLLLFGATKWMQHASDSWENCDSEKSRKIVSITTAVYTISVKTAGDMPVYPCVKGHVLWMSRQEAHDAGRWPKSKTGVWSFLLTTITDPKT